MVENHKMIVENSGLFNRSSIKTSGCQLTNEVVSILSGGNMDVITMASVVQLGSDLRETESLLISVLLAGSVRANSTKVSQKYCGSSRVMLLNWIITSSIVQIEMQLWSLRLLWKRLVRSISSRLCRNWKKMDIGRN